MNDGIKANMYMHMYACRIKYEIIISNELTDIRNLTCITWSMN